MRELVEDQGELIFDFYMVRGSFHVARMERVITLDVPAMGINKNERFFGGFFKSMATSNFSSFEFMISIFNHVCWILCRKSVLSFPFEAVVCGTLVRALIRVYVQVLR